MIIKPRIKGNICTTAHPEGCAEDVRRQIDFIRSRPIAIDGAQRVLVIGASGGYGLATRITCAFGWRASTIGIFFERPASESRTASGGWYRAAAFDEYAADAGIPAWSLNGDAFSNEMRARTIDLIRRELGQVDMVVYSIASPVRTLPDSGEVVRSTLKPVGEPFAGQTIEITTGNLRRIEAPPASEQEIHDTVTVMGGQDWELWIHALLRAGVLAPGAITTNYTYLGSTVTWPIYHHGTIGRAKDDLERAARELRRPMRSIDGRVHVIVMKGMPTVASSAIPGMPLYLSLLFKVMKERGVHEGCIEQTERLFRTRFNRERDEEDDRLGRIHMDDLEMMEDIQRYVMDHWTRVNQENLFELTDFEGYRRAFMQLYGFDFEGVNYDAEVDVNVAANFL